MVILFKTKIKQIFDTKKNEKIKQKIANPTQGTFLCVTKQNP